MRIPLLFSQYHWIQQVPHDHLLQSMLLLEITMLETEQNNSFSKKQDIQSIGNVVNEKEGLGIYTKSQIV